MRPGLTPYFKRLNVGSIYRTQDVKADATGCSFTDRQRRSKIRTIRLVSTDLRDPGVSCPTTLALAEKQKLRYQYGVLERQFRRYFQLALRKRGVTGEILLQLLETRLDNVVQKLGFAKTLRAARQMVSHGHVTVNGRKANISSMNVKAGDKIAVKRSDRSKRLASRAVDQTSAISSPEWLVVDRENLTGTVMRVPTRSDINPIVNEQLVVELYSLARLAGVK